MVILVVAHASLIMAYKLCRITTWLVIIINYPHFALMCVITYAYVNNIASVPTLPILLFTSSPSLCCLIGADDIGTTLHLYVGNY